MATKGLTRESFRPLLKTLVTSPELFTTDDLLRVLDHLFIPSLLHATQIGAFLTALHFSDIANRSEVLTTASKYLLHRALEVQFVHSPDEDFVVDIVGTGGDGQNTFNVSTTAAVVAAGAGARVIKVCFLSSTWLFPPILRSPFFPLSARKWRINLELWFRRPPSISLLRVPLPRGKNSCPSLYIHL